jgi:hypothetical protein
MNARKSHPRVIAKKTRLAAQARKRAALPALRTWIVDPNLRLVGFCRDLAEARRITREGEGRS